MQRAHHASRILDAGTARVSALAERGRVPDFLLRAGIRRMLVQRLAELRGPDARYATRAFAEACRKSPIALETERANDQHYAVPPAFFELVLGPRLKYSCALWDGAASLAQAEERMLEETAARAGIADGMRILDLGCGWGSFSLFAAERFPKARIEAVSNSAPQRAWILAQAHRRGLANLAVTTADVNDFAPHGSFDRVVSIEMFEHLRNCELLMARIARWLAPGGRLFVHHFCHREHAYPYEVRGAGDWMARHFFSGGTMPSEDWLSHFDRDLVVERAWRVSGRDYARTSEAWLARLDAQRDAARAVLADIHAGEADRCLHRWRLFFLACAELFAFRGGEEWRVAHVLLAPRAEARA